MPIHGRGSQVRICSLVVCAVNLFGSLGRGSPGIDRPWPIEILAEADLQDVFFLDARHGWAVGDRGVIWHTEDSGERWQLQVSPIDARLMSVFFADEDHGWAVGGWTQPHTFRSVGTVLTTSNGGRTWSQVNAPTLPMLEQVYFYDPMRGRAIGRGSALYPTGAFRTADGGRSWSNIPGPSSFGWVAGSLGGPHDPVLTSAEGGLGVVHDQRLNSVPLLASEPRRIRDLEIGVRGVGYLVGDGGLILTTRDGGGTWRWPPDGPWTVGMRQFDFAAVAVHNGHGWIGGSPGTRVFHTTDGGATWDGYPTACRVPIRAMTFVDPRRGWAVGALGTILSTRDGGASWQRQAGAGSRVAVLGIYDRPESIPWTLIAHAGGEGYRARIVTIGRSISDPQGFGQTELPSRLHEAALDAGATGADTSWRFPVPSPRLGYSMDRLVESWGDQRLARSNTWDGGLRLEEEIVRAIRLWRPYVLFTNSAGSSDTDALPRLVQQSVLHAARAAADGTAYDGQLSATGMTPWQVRQVLIDVDSRDRPAQNLSSTQLVISWGRTIADLADEARRLLVSTHSLSPPRYGYRALPDPQHPGADRRLDEAIPARPGEDGCRPTVDASGGNLQQLQRVLQRRRNIQGILATSSRQPDGGARWLGQLADLVGTLDATAAGEVIDQIARQYEATGRPDLAAEALEVLIRAYATHPLSEAAVVDLVRYHTSEEVRLRQRSMRPLVVQREGASLDDDVREASDAAIPTERDDGSPAARVASAELPTATDEAPMRALSPSPVLGLETLIRNTRPELFAQPQIRLALLSVARIHGPAGRATAPLRSILATAPTPSWRACVRGEMWLADRRGDPPKPALACTAAPARPRLDGQLRDVVWQHTEAAHLKNVEETDTRWPAEVRFGHDSEFLYVAVRCRKARGVNYPSSVGPRPRDPDLHRHDRVELLMDVNRDYSSYWRLTIDHRGWTGESSMADSTWNPTWYVASSTDELHWYVEAAVPLGELVPRPPAAKDAWLIGIQRTIPGVELQSWTAPASIENVRTEGFGYLIFSK